MNIQLKSRNESFWSALLDFWATLSKFRSEFHKEKKEYIFLKFIQFEIQVQIKPKFKIKCMSFSNQFMNFITFSETFFQPNRLLIEFFSFMYRDRRSNAVSRRLICVPQKNNILVFLTFLLICIVRGKQSKLFYVTYANDEPAQHSIDGCFVSMCAVKPPQKKLLCIQLTLFPRVKQCRLFDFCVFHILRCHTANDNFTQL